MGAAEHRNEILLGDVEYLGGEGVLALHQVGGQILGLIVGHVLRALAGAFTNQMTVEEKLVTGIAAGGCSQSCTLGGIEFLFKVVESGSGRSFVSADPMAHGKFLSGWKYSDIW